MGQLLGSLPPSTDPNVLVATETGDDAGVYRIDDERALVQTVDFFTPILDDPEDFGRVAAANSLSDVYAMGGRPITALAIVCFPDKSLTGDDLVRIMRGAQEKVHEAGAALLGGHSVSDPELKFGLSVTGICDPRRIVRNKGSRPGDLLVLTKPLGTGILATAVKKEKLDADRTRLLTATMATLNKTASEAMASVEVHAGTDVTGFALVGHARGMVKASDVTFTFSFSRLPVLPGALELAASGCLTRGERTNYELTKDVLEVQGLAPEQVSVLKDPQTSGGLLLSVAPADAPRFVADLHARGVVQASIVGEVAPGPARIVVTP